ncbi:MAG: phage tail length tape measure family protein [Treponema sp.]|nr:phage tail length tape measure family protein [Treponema sp.]
MAQELTEELKVFVTAEVNNAISNLQKVDKQTKAAESSFKVLGKTITAAFVATEIIKFSKQSINAWETQKQAVEVLNATLQATGATAWTSSKQLQEMASSLQKITNYGDETIIQMQSVLLGFKNIKGDTFDDATKAILDMATVMKMDLSSAAQAVGKALDDPINGITSLQRQGFRFSEAQKDVIQALIDTGDMAGAQKIILDELNTTYGGAAEAAVTASAQIKNAWGDLQEGVGAFFTGFLDNEAGKKVAAVLQWIGDAFATFHDNIDLLKGIRSEEDFNEYYAGLSDIDKQIEAATLWIDKYTQKISELKTELAEGGPGVAQDMNQHLLEEAETSMRLWQGELQMLQDIQATDQRIQQQKNDQIAAETAISELMHAIGLDYEKLSKDDPVIQLQKYQQQLEKIQKDKETLSSTTTGLDTADAIRQLDYNAEQIKARMQEIRNKLQDDGKKSWQSYFEKVTGVSASSFTTGKEAGQLYIDGLSKAFNDAESLSALLGKKFDAKAAIESQMAELEKTITTLLNIPADKIDEVYSETDNNIKLMIDEYKRLSEEKKKFEVTDALEELNTKVQQLTMSERDLYIQKLQNNGATAEQIEQAEALLKVLEEAQKKSGKTGKDVSDKFISWEDELEKKLLSGIENLQLFKENAEESNKALAEMGVTLTSMSFSAVLQGIGALGEALGKGESAGKGLKDALEETATAVLDQLPMLFLQAGLTLISQGQWGIGLGFVAAGLGTQLVGGINQGVRGNTEANALGNVYGDGVSAFANGGTFTNQIVSSPTLFKFARGGKMGTGLMGEAGPEAIMPLHRGPDGTLGVEASGANVAVILEVNNYSSEKVETQETTDEFGQKKIMVMIGSMINQHIAGGKADKALSSRYGLKAQGV